MTLVLDRTIEASPGQVFAVLADIGQAIEWMPLIQRIDDMSSGPFAMGTNWLETRLSGKRTVKSRIQVTRFEPARVLEISARGQGFEGVMRFTLIPTGAWTHVHYEAEMRGRGAMALFSGTMNRQVEEADRDLLDRLAAQVARSLQDD